MIEDEFSSAPCRLDVALLLTSLPSCPCEDSLCPLSISWHYHWNSTTFPWRLGQNIPMDGEIQFKKVTRDPRGLCPSPVKPPDFRKQSTLYIPKKTKHEVDSDRGNNAGSRSNQGPALSLCTESSVLFHFLRLLWDGRHFPCGKPHVKLTNGVR